MKRTVLITGASKGIGKAIVKELSNDYDLLTPTRSELDLSDDASINQFIKNNRAKKIDVIINNAGINIPQWIEELADENLQKTIQVNLVAPIKLTKGFIGGMKKRRWGRVLNISSAFGIVSRGKQIPYSSTKHGLNGFTKALALEMAPYNVLVNSICPGFVGTDLVLKRNTKEKIELLEKDIPIGRLGTSQEIARVAKFIISDNNTYMTGSIIVVDGGFIIK